MKNKEKDLKFSSKSKKLINAYLKEIQKTLEDAQASQATIKEITEELKDHILQAYWKETESNSIRAQELQEILDAMGNPREIASEYLLDRQDVAKKSSKPSSEREKLPPPRYTTRPPGKPGALLVLPIIIVIPMYIIMIASFSGVGDGWILFLGISDLILLTPWIWYFFGWKKSENLAKFSVISPKRMQLYFIVSGALAFLGGVILPFLRGEGWSYDSPLSDDITLAESPGYYDWGDYYTEYWIDSWAIILANLIQLSLLILFLVAAWKAPISWKQLEVQFDLVDVKLPIDINETGELVVCTTNFSSETFTEVCIEVMGHSSNLQIVIKPSVRSVFAPKDRLTWFIHFTPKAMGMLVFGRIILQLAEKVYSYSPRYHFHARVRTRKAELGNEPSLQKTISDSSSFFPAYVDLISSCRICKQSFSPSDPVMFCTLCGSLFHKTHLQEWLKGHNSCPNCTKGIKVSELEFSYIQLFREHLKQLENESQRLRTVLNSLEEGSDDAMQTMPEIRGKTP
ncbi:MAG: RING finger domain-containing protein [Candidatus Hodarchaeota archaeon]